MSSEPSSADRSSFEAALDAAASRILDLVRGDTAPVVLVDGRSGSGKTTLAGLLAARWGRLVQTVALDDLYPGWDGLDEGVEEARRRILAPRSGGEPAVWRRWDWTAHEWAEEHTVAPDEPLVLEGSGILTPRTAPLSDLAVWLASPHASRKTRAMARDGELYRPHWDRWAAQEERHIARDAPHTLAALCIDIP